MAKFDLVVAAKTVGAGSIKRLGNSMQGVSGKVKNLRLAMGGLNKTFATFGLVISGGAFAGLLKSAIDAGDRFGKLSTQTGIAANTLIAYTRAGKLAGVEQETIDRGLRRLAQSMREADQGVATYKDAFDDLGLSVRNTDGTLKSSEQVLGEIADRFADLPDGATKAAIAMEILGRSGAQLVPFLNMGAKGIKEFNTQVSDRFAKNAEDFNDTLTRIGFSAGEANLQLADNLLPTLNDFALIVEQFLNDKESLNELFKAVEVGFKIIGSAAFATFASVRFLTRSFIDLAKILGSLALGDFKTAFKVMQKGFKDTAEQAKKDFKVIADIINAGQIKEGIEGLSAEEGGTITINVDADAIDDAKDSLNDAFGQAMRDKLKQFQSGLKSVQESMADVVIKGIKGMEDALVNFVMTGKLNFRNLANSIIKDMARIAIQESITKPFTNFIQGLFTKNADGNAFVNGQVQKYAYGGIVNRPTLFPMANGGIGLMGEAGSPEAILPLRRGSNGRLGVESNGGGSTVINVSVDASGSNVQGNTQQANAFGTALATAIQTELIKQKRPGGLLV